MTLTTNFQLLGLIFQYFKSTNPSASALLDYFEVHFGSQVWSSTYHYHYYNHYYYSGGVYYSSEGIPQHILPVVLQDSHHLPPVWNIHCGKLEISSVFLLTAPLSR